MTSSARSMLAFGRYVRVATSHGLWQMEDDAQLVAEKRDLARRDAELLTERTARRVLSANGITPAARRRRDAYDGTEYFVVEPLSVGLRLVAEILSAGGIAIEFYLDDATASVDDVRDFERACAQMGLPPAVIDLDSVLDLVDEE